MIFTSRRIIRSHAAGSAFKKGVIEQRIQHKNRETKPITVEVPIPAELLAVIKATKATGLKTWLIGARGGSFSDQGLTDWFSAEMANA